MKTCNFFSFPFYDTTFSAFTETTSSFDKFEVLFKLLNVKFNANALSEIRRTDDNK